MREFYYKKVLMSVEVPEGKCCCGYEFDRRCKHYKPPVDDGDDTPICTLGFRIVSVDRDGRVLKPNKCRRLKRA